MESQIQEGMARHALGLCDAAPDAMLCTDDAGRIIFWNAAAAVLFRHKHGDILSRPIEALLGVKQANVFKAVTREMCGRPRQTWWPTILEFSISRRNDKRLPIELSLAAWKDEGRSCFGAICRDVSKRHDKQRELDRLIYFDGLTNLPNRIFFLERLEQDLIRHRQFGLLKIGLDNFKEINCSLGLTAGDELLKLMAERISTAVGSSMFMARLGGDVFGVLLTGSGSVAATHRLAERLLALVTEPLVIGGVKCRISASIGLVLSDELTIPMGANSVLTAALLALHQAKGAGGGQIVAFRRELSRNIDQRFRMRAELDCALAQGQFELHFQPQVGLPDRKLVGAEALIRWRHPERGLLAPCVFLPALESTAVAPVVGRWILEQSCAFAADFAARAFPIRIAVNLFSAQLRDGKLLSDVTGALASSGLCPSLLELEITETTVLGLDDEMIEPLYRLRQMGVGIAFDDYGTGFASLSHLKRYPLSRLKLDKDFTCGIDRDSENHAIVSAVLAMARSLHLESTAEGVEHGEEAEVLHKLGCKEAQGYLFGMPMPGAEFLKRLAQGNPLA
ncbi:hypothetical protein AWJ14_00870 [Hoeflea olei]|uniref:Diguanylate cyclase n=1 Tax=Hoeflea olei TaxID=1480615 RepID=A0A1C1YV69_9HYPH|nr:hypothetical protein AWJ14_00870 [Hoeflea olei]